MIENGKVTERGTHEELVKLGGSYAKLNRTQTEGFFEDQEARCCRSMRHTKFRGPYTAAICKNCGCEGAYTA